MSHLDPARPPGARELRGFAFTVGAAFVALALLLAWRARPAAAAVVAAPGAALLLAGALAPARLGGVHRWWMGLALAISRVTTPVLMGVIYFAVITPVGVLMRLAGRRALGPPRGAASAWVDRPAGARASDLRRQF
ncbi:MAG TPA: SxtJ family membrane protein [Gemmatimonadaceae bacterium]|nr:SxtJ family membrane protein [Gemmatimonadaceae bacterium]